MGSASRYGLLFRDPDVTEAAMFPRPELDQAARATTAAVMADWYFGATATLPTQIPFLWIATPAQWRPDQPWTTATVGVTGGATAFGSNAASLAEFGDTNYAATLDTALPADAASLAAHVMFYYATQPGAVPRRRFTVLRFVLNARTRPEQMRILQVHRGDRFVITGAPATWPASVLTQVVEGIAHSIGDSDRVVAWLTSPVAGEVDGTPGPFFRLDTSVLGGPDKTPF